MAEFREVACQSAAYEQTVALRRSVLLEPFGIELTPEDWDAESAFLHFGVFNQSHLLACCFVSPGDANTGKLRQMAVVEEFQGKGFGRRLLRDVEDNLESRGYNRMIMDARKPAVGFYDRLGYRITSDEFELVGIPHFRMEKPLASESESAVIVLLGAPNEPDGTLSPIARHRCERALLEHRRNPDWPILPTGGFGEHFNTAPEPHGFYTTQFLIDQGVNPASILPVADSCYTKDDADKAKPILESTGLKRLILVTSEFHAQRASRIFKTAFPKWRIDLSCALTELPRAELSHLRSHEKKALKRLA
ncbi:MAG: GNAT family N-acetyltransferase [Limisphaerales bacterium]